MPRAKKAPETVEKVKAKEEEQQLPPEVQTETFEGKTDEQIVQIWNTRRGRMAERRKEFEPLWKNGLSNFFRGIISGSTSGQSSLYNTLYEQYDTSIFSRDGLRFNQLKYPMLHAITLRALASEIPNRPKASFVAVGSNDPTKTTAFKHLFNQVLYEMDSDDEDFEILLGRKIFGTSVAMVITEGYELTVKDPTWDNKTGKMSYEKKTKQIKQCLYKQKDLRHVYLDEHCIKPSLKDCNYAQVDEYYTQHEFLQIFKKYGNKTIEACNTVQEKDGSDAHENFYDPKGVRYVRVTHCFDRIQDCYHIIADRTLLNEKDSPIPRIPGRRGKDIPLAIAVQYRIPGAPYGYGDSHVTTSFNHIKDLIRMMVLEITQKGAKGLLAIDPLSNFDEQQFEWGSDFVRISPDEIKQIPIQSDLNSLYKLDDTTDGDVMRSTGININDTSNADTNETARKTVIRRESQNAILELGLTQLTNSFFKRLYTLLKDDIRLYYKLQIENGEIIKVKTDGVKLIDDKRGGGRKEVKVKGFRYFDLKPEDIDMDMELDLEMGNIATSKELDKAIFQEKLSGIAQFIQLFDPKGIAKYIQQEGELPESVLPQDDSSMEGKSPEEIATAGLEPDMLPESVKLNQQNAQASQPPTTSAVPVAAGAPGGAMPNLPPMG